jgi:hypothetical protein
VLPHYGNKLQFYAQAFAGSADLSFNGGSDSPQTFRNPREGEGKWH